MATYVRDRRNTIKEGKLVIPNIPDGTGDAIGVDSVGQIIKVTGTSEPVIASDVEFTSTEGLTATDVAAALDELKALIDALNP